MRIERPSDPRHVRHSKSDIRAARDSAGQPGNYPVPAVIKPVESRSRSQQALPRHASAAFVAQLLAGKMNLDVTRTKRRASPETAEAAYAATRQRMATTRQAGGSSVLM